MKRLLAFIALCLPLYLFAQGFGSFSHDQPFFAKDKRAAAGNGTPCNPLGIPDPATNTIYRWWVSTDNNVALGDMSTNPWVDRIICDISGVSNTLVAINFTNSSSGWYSWNPVGANGAPTNTPLAAGTNATYAIIFLPLPDSMQFYNTATLWSPASPGDAAQQGYPRGFMREGTGQTLRWGTAYKGGEVVIPTLNTNGTTWYDLIMVQNGTTAYFYTNGVLSTSINTTPPAGGWPFYQWGADKDGSGSTFIGKIREIAVWSNTVFTATSISNYHRYATNTYGYTP